MAEDETEVYTHIKKNSKIVVNVDEVLPDIVVVSFTFEAKLFQGVLLDSTKKHLPCGITAPSHIAPPLGNAQVEEAEDKLYSASQRFTYFQDKPAQPMELMANSRFQLKRNIRPPARFKHARMTVRLRPRQVLCSKCRGICNENSENVDLSSKKRKGTESPSSDPPTAKLSRGDRRLRSSGEISPRPIFPDNLREQPKNSHSDYTENKSKKLCPSLIPKLSRLQPKEISNAMNGKVKIKIVGNYWLKNKSEKPNDSQNEVMFAGSREKSFGGGVTEEEDPLSIVLEPDRGKFPSPERTADVLLDSVKEVEVERTELIDEKAMDNSEVDTSEEQDPLAARDPLAIHEDELEDEVDEVDEMEAKRVLRKKRSVGSMEDLWDETVFEDSAGKKTQSSKSRTTPVIKISFGSGTGEGTVLKIPAKVQSYIPSESETEEKKKEKTKNASAKAAKKALKKAKKEARRKVVGGASPVCSLGGLSPRYPNLSPRYMSCMGNMGSASPRHNLVGNSSPAYEVFHTRRHKHKVKHKKRHKEDRKHRDELNQSGSSETKEDDSMREQCLKQKLSISLKRLNANAYMRCDSSSSGSKSPTNSDASDEHSDTVPDFPEHTFLTHDTRDMGCWEASDGRRMAVGDVVWGKILGFPWWPGKVLSISISQKEDSSSTASPSPLAHVAWYGSSTSSLMSCDQLNPFLETFQVRYNKKKRGPYKEAIKQATSEARRGDTELPETPELVEVPELERPELYPSPSEVDVLS